MRDIDLSVTYCGTRLQSPFILSSGPLTYDGDALIRACQLGAGACVTKTIRLEAAVNPIHHISTVGRDSLINCEKWSDLTYRQWFDVEIPKAAAAGVPVIASIGHTPEEAEALVEAAEKAGSSFIELVSYTSDTMLPMLDYAVSHVSIPVICKVSGNWPDTVDIAVKCVEHGAAGICAIDSIGPVVKMDLETEAPAMGSPAGYGWLTGAAIKPISLRYVSDIARRVRSRAEVYSSGGCMNAADALEFMLGGARAVGICTAPILHGMDYIAKLNETLKEELGKREYTSVEAFREAVSQKNAEAQEEKLGRLTFRYEPYAEDGRKKCISCGQCERVCCYHARRLHFPEMEFDAARCRSCGLCADVCPTGALTYVD